MASMNGTDQCAECRVISASLPGAHQLDYLLANFVRNLALAHVPPPQQDVLADPERQVHDWGHLGRPKLLLSQAAPLGGLAISLPRKLS